MTSKEFRKVASRFSKAELIEAVCGNISEWDIGLIALSLKQKKQDSIMHELEMASNAATAAVSDHAAFVRDKCRKYGDGRKFELSQLTAAELKEYNTLWQRIAETQALEIKLQRQFDRLLEV